MDKSLILANNKIFQMLKNSKINNRLNHAYLFYGDDLSGKKEMAYALGCLMYCQNGGCLECSVCKSILDNNHMNIDYIGIEENKTMISKEQIIALQDEFAKTSLVDGSRLYIVDGIDTASSAAQNSLLKFIEEPINKTPITGVFIARDISNVVPTILSRCNLIHFKAVDILDNIKTLESEGLDTLDVRLSLSYINNLNSARELIKSEFFIKNKEYFLEFIDIKTVKNMTIFNIEKQSFYSDIKNLEVLLCFLGVFYKDVSTFKNDSDDLLLKCLYDKIKVYKIDKLLEKRELLLSLNSKLKSNVSPKNVFFEACMKLL